MKKSFSLVLCFLCVLSILSGCSSSSTPADIKATPAEFQQQQPVEPTSATNQEPEQAEPTVVAVSAKVSSITDGDTIKVFLDNKTETVRLIGVDTPETVHPSKPVEPYGPEASAYTTEQLSGKTVYLEFDAQERDRYGRLLAYVWVDEPFDTEPASVKKKMFNALLLAGGYAQVSTYPPNVKYLNNFTAIQKEAREAEKGLWGIKEEPKVTTPAPAPAPAPQEPQTKLIVVSYTQTVAKGSTASITIQGKPNTQYSITVTYKSGPSKASGLEAKTSGSDGKVTWSWKVGSNTTSGSWPIDVKGGGENVQVKFSVQ